jgi:hypothetical protein
VVVSQSAHASRHADDDQQRYARWLEWGTRAGLAIVLVGFALMMSGLAPPLVAGDVLPGLWNRPLAEYLAATGSPTGWGWLSGLAHGDILALAGVAVLAGCSVLGLAAAAGVYLRRRQQALAWICLLEIVVLVLAASNLISAGH